MKQHKSNGRAGIKQIADALNISIGTVDRALHGRTGVSASTRERVLKLAKKLNYTPNVAARNLKLNRHFRIGVFLPEQVASFFDQVQAGIRTAAASGMGANIEVAFHSYSRLREGDIEAMRAHNWRQFDGIILAPGNQAELAPICRVAELENRPIVFVATNAARTHKLSSIAVESAISGGIAAELLGQLIPERRQVVVITGDLKIQDHAEKLRGFAASLATLAPHLTMLPVVESHDSVKDARNVTRRLLRENPRLRGLYISTANSPPVLKAVAESDMAGQVKVIATDLFPEMAQLIEAGQVCATLHQRPFTQGRRAFEVLSRYLVFGTVPKRSIRLAPYIVLRSNLPLFTESYNSGDDVADSRA